MKEEDLKSVIEILSRNVSEENAHFELFVASIRNE